MTISKTTIKKHTPNVQFDKFLRDKDHPYTMISNDKSSFAWDKNLSLAGIGLMCRVQALNQWNFSVAGFSKLVKDGETKISSVIAELIENNYLIVKRLRDKLGRYVSYSYHFFESSAECLKYKEKEERAEKRAEKKFAKAKEKKCAKTMPKTVTPVKQVEQVVQIPVISVQHTEQIKPPDETPDKIITAILEKNIITVTQESAKNTASYLISAVNKGIIALDAVKDKLNAIIDKQHSLDAFLHILEERCTNALTKLKHPHAKYSFIRKTMVNILNEYDLESPEPAQQPAQPVQQSKLQANTHPKEDTMPPTLSFRDLLIKLHCSLPEEYADEEYYGISFDSAEKFWETFNTYAYDYDISECSIDDDLRYNPENMENALKFLMGWNGLKAGEFKSFSEYAISCLADVLKTGKCCGEVVGHSFIICHLNCINWGGKDEYERETNEESIRDFMENFFEYYCKKIIDYPPKTSNKKGYITKMLVNYIKGEYQATHAHFHAALKNLDTYSHPDTDSKNFSTQKDTYEDYYQRFYDRRY